MHVQTQKNIKTQPTALLQIQTRLHRALPVNYQTSYHPRI